MVEVSAGELPQILPHSEGFLTYRAIRTWQLTSLINERVTQLREVYTNLRHNSGKVFSYTYATFVPTIFGKGGGDGGHPLFPRNLHAKAPLV